MGTAIGIAISVAALVVSVGTAWLTLLRKGRVSMTRPTQVYFRPGIPGETGEASGQQIMVRSLIYSTAQRGQIIENMFASIRRGETRQNFNIWVYGERGDLRRGSGLFVDQRGITVDHYFLPPDDGSTFNFRDGDYTVEVFATLVGSDKVHRLSVTRLRLPFEMATTASSTGGEIFFDWGPDSGEYHPHLRTAPPRDEALSQLASMFSRSIQTPNESTPATTEELR